MGLSYVEGAVELILEPGVPITALVAPMGATATVLVGYTSLEPLPSGVVTIQTSWFSEVHLDVHPIGSGGWVTSKVVQGGGSVVLQGATTAPTALSVKFSIEPNPCAWKCGGCGIIQLAGALRCLTCGSEPRNR